MATTNSQCQTDRQRAVRQEPTPSTGAIQIELPGRAAIRVERGADRAVLLAILESLRA
jgi:hypothetical protein